MGILLWLMGLLAIGSGALKLTSRVRELVDRSPLAVAEVAVGVVVVLASGLSLGRLRPLAWTAVVVTATLVILSSVQHARRVAERYRRRMESEERRLRERLDP